MKKTITKESKPYTCVSLQFYPKNLDQDSLSYNEEDFLFVTMEDLPAIEKANKIAKATKSGVDNITVISASTSAFGEKIPRNKNQYYGTLLSTHRISFSVFDKESFDKYSVGKTYLIEQEVKPV